MTPTKRKIIGITGGIASGKSSFSNILIKKGLTVIDADKISRGLLEKGLASYEEIVCEFGSGILKPDKSIDRKALGKIIFDNKESRDKLEGILHPYIFKEIKTLIDEYSKREDFIFVDIPLLYEKYNKLEEYAIHLDQIYLVYVDRQTQVERLIKRDSISSEEANRKIDTQISMEEKKKLAHRIIYNTGDLKELELEVERVIKDLH